MIDFDIRSYVDYLCSLLTESSTSYIHSLDDKDYFELDDKRVYYRNKISPKFHKKYTIEVVEKYTRSAKIKISFNVLDKSIDYEFIFYISRRIGPEILLDKFYSKANSFVNKTLTEEYPDYVNRVYSLYDYRFKKKAEKIHGKFKKKRDEKK